MILFDFIKGDAVLPAELVQRRFEAELRKFEHWAAMPTVIGTALDHKCPELLSAFDRYAIRAFEVTALDYHLKPVIREDQTSSHSSVALSRHPPFTEFSPPFIE